MLNNLMWIALFTAITVPLGLVLAVLSGRVRYEGVAKSAVFMPMAISFVAASVIWRSCSSSTPTSGRSTRSRPAWEQTRPRGCKTRVRRRRSSLTGAQTPCLRRCSSTTSPVIGVGIWMWTGFAMVVLSAGLKGISTEMLEAARVDGATEWQVFWRIIMPTLRPTIIVVATTLVINALKIFDLVWVMTGGRFGTDVVATLFFKQAFITRDFGVGAALAFILLLAVVPLMAISIRRFQYEAA